MHTAPPLFLFSRKKYFENSVTNPGLDGTRDTLPKKETKKFFSKQRYKSRYQWQWDMGIKNSEIKKRGAENESYH